VPNRPNWRLRGRFDVGMEDPFENLAKALDVGPVTKPAHRTRPQRMNANSFCVHNKVFAMHVGNDLVIKLAPKRVAELIEAGIAVPNLVGGRPMKEWATLRPGTEKKWFALAKESLDYVRDKR
jgi:hypothetical protein